MPTPEDQVAAIPLARRLHIRTLHLRDKIKLSELAEYYDIDIDAVRIIVGKSVKVSPTKFRKILAGIRG